MTLFADDAAALAVARSQVVAGDLAHVEALRTEVLAHVDTHPDALRRTSAAAHLTASALVVDPGTRRFVVLHHAKLGRWLQPGGHADGDGDLATAALREATEETALTRLEVDPVAVDLDIHVVRPPSETPHRHLDLRFVVLAPAGASGTAPPGNHESTAIRWIAEADLDALGADASLRRLVARGLARVRRVRAR